MKDGKLEDISGRRKGIFEGKINKLESNSKNKDTKKLPRGIKELKKGYQLKTTW
jgi:hypothetical protein